MPLKTRRILFYSFVVLFIIAGAGTVFYSRGWRINVMDCQIAEPQYCRIKIQKTGAIYIETGPKDVIIKIDGKVFGDKSGLIQKGTLIDGLSPKTYKAEVEKSGYLPWRKNFKVESSLVSEGIKIILIPEKVGENQIIVGQSVENFWVNQQEKLVFKNKGILYYFQSPSAIKLRGNDFVVWSQDGNKIITRNTATKIYYLYDINDLKKSTNLNVAVNNLDKKISIDEIKFYPADSGKLIIKGKNGLFIFDSNRLAAEIITLEPIIAWDIDNPNIFYVKKSQSASAARQNKSQITLNSFNFIMKNEAQLAELPSGLKNISGISASDNNIMLFNKDDGLYFFDQETKKFQQIAGPTGKFAFSPDNKKFAFSGEDGQLNVYFLKDYDVSIHKKAGQMINFDFYKNSPIKNIFWYEDSHHLFVEYAEKNCSGQCQKVDIIELDDRLPVNKYTLAERVLNSYYDKKSNKIYFIRDGSLHYFDYFTKI